MIPNFTIDEVLPAGIYSCTFDEFKDRFGYNYRRQQLLIGMEKMVEIVQQFGEPLIYIDGSFVTQKELPKDYDACIDFKKDNKICYQNLVTAHPVFWNFSYDRQEQKNQFGGEFFPAFMIEGSINKTFLEFFQLIKFTNVPKGIILLNL